jgi:type I restriction enzyme S subunit
MMKAYEKYRETENELLVKIPNHWQIVKLKYIVSCNDDVISVQPTDDYQINYIEIGDVSLQKGIFNSSVQNIQEAPSRARRVIKKNDVIISTVRTYLKAISMVSEPFDGYIASTGFAVLRAKEVHHNFLNYLVQNETFIEEIISKSVGASYPAITSNNLLNIVVPLPSPSEQSKIAQYLDYQTSLIDQLIQQKEKLVALLKEKRQSVINEAVTKGLNPNVPMKDSGIEWLGEVPEEWTKGKLKHFCKFIYDGTHGSYQRVEAGYRLLSVRNIVNGKFVFRDDDSKVSESDFLEISSKFKIVPDDLQLAIVGATLGKVAIVELLAEEFVTQRSLATIRVKSSRVFPKYLLYFLQSTSFQSFLWRNSSFSAQPGVYLGTIQNCDLAIPQLPEQSFIVKYLVDREVFFENLISKIDSQVILLKEYRQSIISEAVTGKVDVRHWQPPTQN